MRSRQQFLSHVAAHPSQHAGAAALFAARLLDKVSCTHISFLLLGAHHVGEFAATALRVFDNVDEVSVVKPFVGKLAVFLRMDAQVGVTWAIRQPRGALATTASRLRGLLDNTLSPTHASLQLLSHRSCLSESC